MAASLDILTEEVFRYRVIYPGGTYIRISPSQESEKTGEILEAGTIFESQKSLFLDGVNYIKLSFPYEGWVFESKNGIDILELVDIERKTVSIPKSGPLPILNDCKIISYEKDENFVPEESGDSSKTTSRKYAKRIGFENISNGGFNTAAKEKLIRVSRHETKYWRDIRTSSLNCKNFDDFLKLVEALEEEGMNSDAQGISWIPQTPKEIQIKELIKLLVAVTRQCVEGISDCTLLESALWVLVHTGSRTASIIEFAVEAANQRYERLEIEQQRNLLHIVLEVGGRTKSIGSDLSKLVDMLPDDVRNFLQRWVFIKVIEQKAENIDEPEDDVVEMTEPNDDDGILNAPATSFRRTPATVKVTPPSSRRNSWWSFIPQSFPSCEGNVITFQKSGQGNGSESTGNEDQHETSTANTSTIQGQTMTNNSSYWTGMQQRLNHFLNDPNVQFASMI